MKDVVDSIDFEWAGLSLQLYPVEGSASLSDRYTVSPSSCVASLLGNKTWLARVTRLGVRIWKDSAQKLLSLEKYWQNFWWRHVMRHFNKNTTHISKDCESCLSVLYIFWQWNSTCEGHQTRGQNLKRQCTEITDIGKIMAKFDERILNVSSTNKNKDFENSSLHF